MFTIKTGILCLANERIKLKNTYCTYILYTYSKNSRTYYTYSKVKTIY